MLQTLVAFDTTSRESNLQLIEFVRDYLASLDVPCELIYNEERSKANLFATIGPADKPGIVLSGHTDVVPVDGQPWTVAPFELTERDGKLFGRGTADMKGYIACVLALVPSLVKRLAAPAGAHRPVLRRRSRLPGRALVARGAGATPGQTAAVHHRRTDRTETGARPQGQTGDALRCARSTPAIRPMRRLGSMPLNTPPN